MDSRIVLFTLAAMGCSTARAVDGFDPFGNEALVPPRPQLSAPWIDAHQPCKPLQPDTVLDALRVVDLALCQNPDTHEAWANARAQAAQVGVAQADYLPVLDGKASTSLARSDAEQSKQHKAALTLSWLLYDFGARSATLENARQLLSAATSTLDASVQTVFLGALQSYYNVQAARAAVTAALESEKASRESLNAAEVRYQVGSATPADRLQAQTAWSQATLTRIKAEGTLKTAQGSLARMIGQSASTPLRLVDIPQAIPETPFAQDIETLIEEARARRPDLRAAEAKVQAAQANVAYARAADRPTLSLGAGPSWQKSKDSDGYDSSHGNAIGLTLNIPLFAGFSSPYKVRSAQAKAEAAGAQRDALHLQVALEVWNAYQNLTTATQTIRTSADLLASAEQSERVALGRYKAGVGNILNLLNAQSALAAARLQRIQAMLDWHISRAALARAIGTLDNRLLNPAANTTMP